MFRITDSSAHVTGSDADRGGVHDTCARGGARIRRPMTTVSPN